MARGIERRQKPVWKRIRKPLPPPSRIQPSKKKEYTRKDRSLREEE